MIFSLDRKPRFLYNLIMTNGHKVAADGIKAFVLAGNAVFTIQNPLTGNRFTYRVRQGKGEKAPHFVQVLTGSNNETDYQYLGVIFPDGTFRVTGKTRIGKDAPSARAFAWTWAHLQMDRDIGPAEVWHQGRCGRCGRTLTVPESVATGLGPDCAEKMGNVIWTP